MLRERILTATTNRPVLILGPIRKRVLQRRIRIVVAITITYNVLEAIIALAAGTSASKQPPRLGMGRLDCCTLHRGVRHQGGPRSMEGRHLRRSSLSTHG